METVKENKMATMPVGKLLLQMAIPLILSMLVQALYNIFDSMFVSYIPDGKIAFNAVTLANSIQLLMIAVGTGIGVGMNAYLSKSLGENNKRKVDSALRNGMFLAVVAWILFIILGIMIPSMFMKSQTTNGAIIEEGTTYLRIVMCGSVFLFFQFVFERSLQGTGRASLSMISQIAGAVTNIILDPLFIFTFDMGIEGAAIATVIGQFVGAIIGFLLNLFKNHDISFKVHKEDKFIDGTTIGIILKVGIPSMIMVAIGSILTFGIMAILKGFTESEGLQTVQDAQNAYGAYMKLQSFVFMPLFGLNNALVPIVSFNFGRKDKHKMYQTFKYCLISGVVIMTVGFILFETIPGTLLKIFNADGSMLTFGIKTLRVLAISFLFAGFGIVISSWFQALGNGLYSMIVSFARQLVVLLPVAYLLSFTHNIQMIWWAFPIAEIVGIVLSVIFFIKIHKEVVSKI